MNIAPMNEKMTAAISATTCTATFVRLFSVKKNSNKFAKGFVHIT
jgi:hypothetical protein